MFSEEARSPLPRIMELRLNRAEADGIALASWIGRLVLVKFARPNTYRSVHNAMIELVTLAVKIKDVACIDLSSAGLHHYHSVPFVFNARLFTYLHARTTC